MFNQLMLFIAGIVWSLSWQVTLLVPVLIVLSYVFRKTQPLFHYYLWSIVLLRLILPVNIHVPISLTPHVRILAEKSYSKAVSKKTTFDNTRLQLGKQTTQIANSDDNKVVKSRLSSYSLPEFLLVGWMSISALLLGLVGFWMWYTKMKLKESPIVDRADVIELLDQKKRVLRIRNTVLIRYLTPDFLRGPCVTGFITNTIYLPDYMIDKWSVSEIEPILTHELVHVKRYDTLINWIQIFIQMLFFYHPLVWYANGRIRQYREEACDDISIACIENKRKRYSKSILHVLESIVKEPRVVFADVSFTERKDSLARRIIRLTNVRYNYYKPLSVYSKFYIVVISLGILAISCDSSNTIFNAKQDDLTVSSKTILSNEDNTLTVTVLDTERYKIEDRVINKADFKDALMEAMNTYQKNNLNVEFIDDALVSEMQYINDIAYSIGINSIFYPLR